MLPPVDQPRHCSFLHKLCTLTSNLCIFAPTVPSPETSSQPQAASQIAIYHEMVTSNLPGEPRMAEGTTIVKLITVPRHLTWSCTTSITTMNKPLFSLTDASIFLETELPREEDFSSVHCFLLDTNGVCKVFCKCWVNCSCREDLQSSGLLFTCLSFIKPGMDLLNRLLRGSDRRKVVFGRISQSVFVATHTLMVKGMGLWQRSVLTKAVFMGCRKKVLRILPFPILHSCFSILTCSAFQTSRII